MNCTPSSPSSKNVAARSTAFAGAIPRTANPARRWQRRRRSTRCWARGTEQRLSSRSTKQYGSAFLPYAREITKPVAGTVLVAVDGNEQAEGADFTVDTTIGLITFLPGRIPATQTTVTAGFEFDVPVRFDTDRLEVNVMGFKHGAIPSIPILEVRR